jgi:hypothetical protein
VTKPTEKKHIPENRTAFSGGLVDSRVIAEKLKNCVQPAPSNDAIVLQRFASRGEQC